MMAIRMQYYFLFKLFFVTLLLQPTTLHASDRIFYEIADTHTFSSPSMSYGETLEPHYGTVDTISDQMKSLLVPGWGQISQGKPIKGGLFLGTSLMTLGLAIYFNERANTWYDRYQDATDPVEISHYRDRTEADDIRRNQSILAFSLNYLINLIDIYWYDQPNVRLGPVRIDLSAGSLPPDPDAACSEQVDGIMLNLRLY
ncbi:hypothetical protein JXQ70_08760 [bacterium]|nr:hypothetical protein [bacterium]